MNMIEREPKGHGVRISTEKKKSHTSLKRTKSGTLPQTRTRNLVRGTKIHGVPNSKPEKWQKTAIQTFGRMVRCLDEDGSLTNLAPGDCHKETQKKTYDYEDSNSYSLFNQCGKNIQSLLNDGDNNFKYFVDNGY